MVVNLYLNNSIASAPVIPILMPSLVASLDTALMVALSISLWALTPETMAQASSAQASTLM